MYSNLSYPQWTSDDIAIPSMIMASSVQGSMNESQTGSISATVSAVRGVLDCSPVPSKYIQSVDAAGAGPQCYGGCNDIVQVDYLMTLPWSLCTELVTNQTNATWSQRYLTSNDSATVYNGIGTGLQWDLEAGITGDGAVQAETNSGGMSYDTQFIDNTLPSCPSVSFSIGTTKAGRKTNKTVDDGEGIEWKLQSNINIMYCYQRLERVMTNVTFTYPDFAITSALLLDSTVQNISSPNVTLKSEY